MFKMSTTITPETFLSSHLTLENFKTITNGTPDQASNVLPTLSINTGSGTGYKLFPTAGASSGNPDVLHIANQTASSPTTVQIGTAGTTHSAPIIAQTFNSTEAQSRLTIASDVELIAHSVNSADEASKLVFPATSPGAEQTLTAPMIDRTNGTVTDTEYVNGVKFSHDAEFTVPNPKYNPNASPQTEEPTVNIRISDLYRLISNIQNFDNVISALCRANNFQLSNTSVENDAAWIQAYANVNTTQPVPPDPVAPI